MYTFMCFFFDTKNAKKFPAQPISNFPFAGKIWRDYDVRLSKNNHFSAKGQLISKCPFGIIVWTKIPRNYFWISALKFFVPSWGLPGSFLGLPVGFHVYDITY